MYDISNILIYIYDNVKYTQYTYRWTDSSLNVDEKFFFFHSYNYEIINNNVLRLSSKLLKIP